MAQDIALLGVAVVFIIVGLTNKKRGKGPWIGFLFGGIVLAALKLLDLMGIIRIHE